MIKTRGVLPTLACFMIAPAFAFALSAEDILVRTDEIRFPAGDYAVQVTVQSLARGRPTGENAGYEVWTKGREKTLVKTLSPMTDRGTSLLMLGKDLWAFLPSVAKPLRISLQQRLMGEVSNGDLARANFVGDYKPSLTSQSPKLYVLLLKAKNDDVTYGSVKLWVNRQNFRPLKAAFYASSGRILKVGTYEDFKTMGGGIHPGRIIFEDAVVKGKVSILTYSDISPRADLADKYFTKDYLKKLKY